jgi:Na+/melibiose symporter-like transporter
METETPEKFSSVVSAENSDINSKSSVMKQHDNQNEKIEAGSNGDATNDAYTIFSNRERQAISVMVCLAGFFSPISAFIFFPAIPYLSRDLSVSVESINLTITGFLVVQAIIPSILGDLADQVGRRPTYLLALTIYTLASIGLTIQKSYAALFVLRIFQSAGSSGMFDSGASFKDSADFASNAHSGNECYGGHCAAT